MVTIAGLIKNLVGRHARLGASAQEPSRFLEVTAFMLAFGILQLNDPIKRPGSDDKRPGRLALAAKDPSHLPRAKPQQLGKQRRAFAFAEATAVGESMKIEILIFGRHDHISQQKVGLATVMIICH
jgi:hypothetical protein